MKNKLSFTLFQILVILLSIIVSSLDNDNPVYMTDSTTFISIWDTSITNDGSSNADQIKLPLTNTGSYNFDVNWGDGNTDTITSWNQPEATHTYTTSGIYTIIITGTIEGWRFNSVGDAEKILKITQWGTLRLGNQGSYFAGAVNLDINATDTLDLNGTTVMTYAFADCVNLKSISSINTWNTSAITEFSSMFFMASSFNQPLGNWNTSNASSISSMFHGAESFNQDISMWDVSGVDRLDLLFMRAKKFNKPLNNWNVSAVTSMTQVFMEAGAFNQPLNSWNVSKVTRMPNMFNGASSFNQDLSSWDVSQVVDMGGMFSGASAFNQPLNPWDVSKLEDMGCMFDKATSFNQPLDGWNTSAVTDMVAMFAEAESFNHNIETWDTGSATHMVSMFSSASTFNHPLNSWDVSKVTDFQGMFAAATAFDQPLDLWNMSSARDLGNMFVRASSFNQSIGSWDLANVNTTTAMFSQATSFNQPLNTWNMSSVVNMGWMFTSTSFFNQPLDAWDTSSVTTMAFTFAEAPAFDQDLGTWNVSAVTNMMQMLTRSGLSIENYDSTLNGWATQTLQQGVILDALPLKYSADSADSRQQIIDIYNWVINDGGLIEVPTAPRELEYTIEEDVVSLSWTRSLNEGNDEDFLKYLIFRSEGDTNNFQYLDEVTGISYDDATVEDGKTYHYIVYAENRLGRSEASNQIEVSLVANTSTTPTDETSVVGLPVLTSTQTVISLSIFVTGYLTYRRKLKKLS